MDYENKTVKERFDHLFQLIKSQEFLDKKLAAMEIPFYLCPFDPAETLEMEKTIQRLTRKLEQNGVQVLDINLYDLALQLLKARDIFDQVLQMEESVPKDQLKELLQNVLDPETHLIPAIAAKMKETSFHVMFITGTGEVFPYLRVHNVLNNLQRVARERPTVIFFPGRYSHSDHDGSTLDLFGLISDDKYYRAFNIYHCKI